MERERGIQCVGVGASAGGLEPLEQFLRAIPASTHLAFVVVQHLDSRHSSMLVDLLARSTAMPVVQATDAERPRPDHVYVIAPGTVLTLENGAFHVASAPEVGARATIDTFLRSLADECGDRAVGIVLSGAGHDGTVGLRAIKQRGGLTFAQSPETARHSSMPQSAIDAGLADYVLPPALMPAKLLEHTRHAEIATTPAAAAMDARLAGGLESICSVLHQRTGHDFGRYKPGTVQRRIRRRMQIHRAESVDAYLGILEADPGEPGALLKDLLIGVTQFFRDPEAFEALAQQALRPILQGKEPDAPIRIWVPGCASGEEAYTLAILLRELLDSNDPARRVQIFATDLDAETLARARRGRYAEDVCEPLSPERLARYFTHEKNEYAAIEQLREMCTFSTHNLIRDPPFSRLDLISCRNVLIYLNADLQKKLVPIFHSALVPGGILLLGPSETMVGSPDLFEIVDKKHRIYRRMPAEPRSSTWSSPGGLRLGRSISSWPSTQPLPARASAGAKDLARADAEAPGKTEARSPGTAHETVDELESELSATRAQLRRTVQELESANEQLASANEELVTSNEELQSANEELQALNEELETVNTELREKVDELAEANAMARRHAQLLHLSHDAIFVWQIDGGIESWNQGAQLLYGYSAEEAIGRVSHELLATVFPKPLSEIEQDLRAGSSWAGELVHRTKDGRTVTVLSNLQLARGDDGVERILEANRDISERKKAEQRQGESEATLRGILNATTESVWLFSIDGIALAANETALARWGRPPETVIGKPVSEFMPNEQGRARLAKLEETARTRRAVEFEDVRAGIRFEHTFYPVVNADGTVDRIAVFSQDVTERWTAAEALRESEERFRTLASNAQDAIARFDREGRYVYANPFVAGMLGLPDEAIVGKTVEALGRNVNAESFEARLREVLDTGKPLRFDRRSVEGRWFDVQLIPEFHGDQVATVLAISRDVTERKSTEEALAKANLRLEEADRRKNEFLAVLSHELRNPLTPIRNGLRLVERAEAGSEQFKRALDVMDRQTTQLARLVDDLLDVTRISSNKVRLQRQALDFNDLVRRTVEDHRSLFDSKEIKVETSLSSQRLAVDGDAARLAQVVGNLLQNAAKFTPSGGRVSIGTDASESRDWATLRVADSGAGIEPAMQRHLFEPFMQADTTLDRSKGGLGLGLALVRGLVEMHGGHVRAHSEGADQGAEFVVELPIGGSTRAISRSESGARSHKSRRVLIIEDNADAADSLREVLELEDHAVQVAYDGPQGLAQALAFKPDLVLCDIGLPGMSGFEVAKAFRADPSLRTIVLVALSGYALPEDLQRAELAGFHRHLAKPPSMDLLERLLADLPEAGGSFDGH